MTHKELSHKEISSKGGKASVASRKKKGTMSEQNRKAAAARWKKYRAQKLAANKPGV